MKFNLQMLEGKQEPAALEELLAFRFEDGTGFPASYIEFAKQYGYGVTCDQFLIYVPLGDYCDSFKNQSRAIRGTYSDVLGSAEDVWFDLAPDVDFEKLKRLIPFAGSENGNYLFWDPARKTPDEMDIYITDFRGLGFVKAAANLQELIEKMTSAERYKEVSPLFYKEPLPATFRPVQKHI
jgi:hypothetical protein